MATSSTLQTDSLLQSRKKRSFSLQSFRRSSAVERQEVVRSEEEMQAEEAARVQKAAAWQWYARGVGEAVVPTKRPPLVQYPPSLQAARIDDNNTNVLQKKPLEAPLGADHSRRAASRFKAEAGFAPPTASAATPSAGPNSTPLYDEFELSGLRAHMADFVQRLQFTQSPAQKSKPLHISVDHGRPLADHLQSKAPPSAPAAISRDHLLRKPRPPSAIPFHMRPFSALHRLFRKVVSGSIIKSTKNSPNCSPAFYEPEVLPEENTPYHFHHYIHHHHHHHYHYGESPAAIIHSRGRRHSESSGIHPQYIPSLLEAESDEEEEEVERSSIEAYLTSRRRHSESFAGHLTPQKAAFDEEEEMNGGPAKEALPLQLPRRYDSEKLTPNKIPTMVSEDLAQPAPDEEFPRRRHSAENLREGASLERKAEGGGKSRGGTYKLGGAADGAMAARPLLRRRQLVHYEMRKCTPAQAHSPARAAAQDLPPIYPG